MSLSWQELLCVINKTSRNKTSSSSSFNKRCTSVVGITKASQYSILTRFCSVLSVFNFLREILFSELVPELQCLLKFKVELNFRTESLAYENGHLEITEIITISCIL